MTKSCQQEKQSLTLDNLTESLRKKGLKVTQQRMLILQALVDSVKPLSADELLSREGIQEEMDLVTVYRCLKKFEDSDLVTRLEFGDGVARFELTFESGHHHHHVVCRKCHKVEVLHICDLDVHLKAVQAMGYKSVQHRLDFFGVCPQCQS